jgi:hypothetical protein
MAGSTTYDQVYRLIGTERGNLVSGAIQNLAFEQQWGLDAAGNFATFKEDVGGDGFELDQTREHNLANETGDISGDRIDPQHDMAGNVSSYTCASPSASDR